MAELFDEGHVVQGGGQTPGADGVGQHGVVGEFLAALVQERAAHAPVVGDGGDALGAVADARILARAPPAADHGGHEGQAGVLDAAVDEPAAALVALAVVHAAFAVDHVAVEDDGIKGVDLEHGAAPPVAGLGLIIARGGQEVTARNHAVFDGIDGEAGLADHAGQGPGRGLEAVQGDGQGQEVGVEFVGDLGGGGVVGAVGVDQAGETEVGGQRVLDQRRLDGQGGEGLVVVLGGQDRRIIEDRGMGQGDGLQAGRHLDVGVGHLELEIGFPDGDGDFRVGGGEGAGTPGLVADHGGQAEFHGLAGDEVGAQAETFPDLKGVFGLGAGGVPGGPVAVLEEHAVDTGVTGHFDFCGRVGSGRAHGE